MKPPAYWETDEGVWIFYEDKVELWPYNVGTPLKFPKFRPSFWSRILSLLRRHWAWAWGED